jgi:hypothetical protein
MARARSVSVRSLDPLKIRRLKPLPLEQDCEHQFAGGLLLARLKTKAARGGERID